MEVAPLAGAALGVRGVVEESLLVAGEQVELGVAAAAGLERRELLVGLERRRLEERDVLNTTAWTT